MTKILITVFVAGLLSATAFAGFESYRYHPYSNYGYYSNHPYYYQKFKNQNYYPYEYNWSQHRWNAPYYDPYYQRNQGKAEEPSYHYMENSNYNYKRNTQAGS